MSKPAGVGELLARGIMDRPVNGDERGEHDKHRAH